MRIIAGEFRTRLIDMPKSVRIRPTQDKVREALFNVLKDRVIDSVALDLFAGSGSFGLEAISRGARRAVFIDKDPRCIITIKENVKALAVEDKSDIIRANCLSIMNRLFAEYGKFDLVFLDPPYHTILSKKILLNLIKYDILAQSAIVIAEHHKKEVLPDRIESLLLLKNKQYGDTVLSFYKKI